MAECVNKARNLDRCPCTWPNCPRKGICCECLHYHLAHGELPACCFPPEVERTYDRSFRRFAELYGSG
ncbi:MAG: cytosolic protein [Caldiserica bacterium]|nr:cytosolic protein [Caldisericota bacterium]